MNSKGKFEEAIMPKFNSLIFLPGKAVLAMNYNARNLVSFLLEKFIQTEKLNMSLLHCDQKKAHSAAQIPGAYYQKKKKGWEW